MITPEMKKKKKPDTAIKRIEEKLDILIGGLSTKACWRISSGAHACTSINPKATELWKSVACGPCRARRYLAARRKK